MLIKPPELTIDPQNPFANDAFDRQGVVESLAQLIGQVSGPFVFAIDAPWGSGKTTFIRMLHAKLEADSYACLHFNAWETDFAEDPLIAFMGDMDSLIRSISSIEADRLEALDKAKRIAGAVAKRTIPAAIKIATFGALDISVEAEKVIADVTGALADDAVDRYQKDKALIDEFHGAVDQALALASEAGKRLPLVIFVDELDRCRPLYAIELLERIKHIFNVKNAIFILSVDKEQLGISLGAVYGNGFNSTEYLRRFFDLEFKLKQVDSDKFCESLLQRMELNEVFSAREGSTQRYELNRLKRTFRSMSRLYELSPRAQEQCMSLITIAIVTTPNNHYLFPEAVVILSAIKIGESSLYHKVTKGEASICDLYDDLRNRGMNKGNLQANELALFLGVLLAIRAKDDKRADSVFETIYRRGTESNRSDQIDDETDMVLSITREHEWRSANFQKIVKRIDLAAQFS